MRILYLTGREIGYSRNQTILRAFRRLGQVDVVAPDAGGKILARSLKVTIQSLSRLRSEQYDLVYVGFFGQIIMLSVGWITNRPVLFDAFLSSFDTLTGDRGQFAPASLPGKIARWVDTTSCRLADFVLLDTVEHVEYFINTFDLDDVPMAALPVGCNEDLFFPTGEYTDPARENGITVLYYCSYLPLHGTEYVVQAAAEMSAEASIHFRLIGDGPELTRAKALASDLDPRQISFRPSVPLEQLPKEIAQADICLGGHFGLSEKAGRVVPGKIYQMLAVGKPVIARDAPANRRLLKHLEFGYLCPPGDPEALATAIVTLARDPGLRARLAQGGRRVYENKASEERITRSLAEIIEQVTA